MSNGFDQTWCMNSDSGLPRPHLVIFMDIDPERAAQRAGFGDELYEKLEFQKKVYENFKKLKEDNWVMVNADQPIEKVTEEIIQAIKKFLPTEETKLQPLWPLNN